MGREALRLFGGEAGRTAQVMFRRFGERFVVRAMLRLFGGGAGGGLGRLFLIGGGGGEKFFCKNGLKTIDIVS